MTSSTVRLSGAAGRSFALISSQAPTSTGSRLTCVSLTSSTCRSGPAWRPTGSIASTPTGTSGAAVAAGFTGTPARHEHVHRRGGPRRGHQLLRLPGLRHRLGTWRPPGESFLASLRPSIRFDNRNKPRFVATKGQYAEVPFEQGWGTFTWAKFDAEGRTTSPPVSARRHRQAILHPTQPLRHRDPGHSGLRKLLCW